MRYEIPQITKNWDLKENFFLRDTIRLFCVHIFIISRADWDLKRQFIFHRDNRR